MAAVAAVLFVYRKIYPDSVLVTDALPRPGEMFRGNIETPLEGEPPSECTVHIEIILPVEFLVPAEVRKDLDEYCSWRVTGAANVRPIPFRAAFLIEDSSRNPKASA